MAKRIIGIVIATVIIVSSLPFGVFAKTQEEKIPHLNIHGFMCCNIYEDKTNPDSKTLWPPQNEKIKSSIGIASKELFKYMFHRNQERLMSELCPVIFDLFEELCCDDDGNPIVEGSGPYVCYPTREELLKNPTIEFAYDWRLDPFEIAEDLNDFINYLCDDLDFGQVVIECHSNAGTILVTYFEQYGTQKVKSCCFSATSVYGAGVAEKIIDEELLIDSEGIKEYLINLFSNGENAIGRNLFVKILSRMNVFEKFADFANNLLTVAHDDIYEDVVFPIFGKWLNAWAMFPDESVDDCIDLATKNFGFDKDGKDKLFYEKLVNFDERIRQHREDILDNINNNCNLYVFCFYDFPGVPVATDWNTMSDGILYSEDTSFGATFKNYISTARFKDGEYISPDGKCDASTAKFKDQTWYFKSCFHILKNDFLNDMAKDLLYYDGQATVETFEKYPQFLKYRIFGMTIVAQ